jgi:hypothetical protein
MGLRPWIARTREDYARMLQTSAAPGDTERAEELLATAVAAYRELGMDTATENSAGPGRQTTSA